MTAIAIDARDPPSATGLGHADLLARLRASIDFADRTVLAADREHSLWRVDLGQVSGFEKLLLEASILALLASRTGCVDDQVAVLLASIAGRADRAALVRAIRRQPALVTTLGTALIILDRFGSTSEEEHRALESALDSPYVECFERTPFRLLDRAWVMHIAGRTTARSTAPTALTTAARRTHPIYLAREDVYAITHTVMYATDFGARRPPAILRTARLWESIDACIAWCLAARDFDLVAELLLAQLMLRRRLSPYGRAAWQVAQHTWDRLGFLPGPSLSARDFEALEEDSERRQYAHYHMYHTMFVGGLLAGALLGAEVDPPSPDAESDAVAIAPGVDGHEAHDPEVPALIAEWRDAGVPGDLRSLAVDALIIRYAKDYELDQLADALRSGAELEMPSPTVLVGSHFLAAQLAGPPPALDIGPRDLS
jgi:Domain of unknown function (DUF6895)